MKQCSVCQEEFADKFSFCPVDGTPLNQPAAPAAQSSAADEDTATIPASTAGSDAPKSGVVLQQTMASVGGTPVSAEPSSDGEHEFSYDEQEAVSATPYENEYHL